jgi:hypothetical protein
MVIFNLLIIIIIMMLVYVFLDVLYQELGRPIFLEALFRIIHVLGRIIFIQKVLH